MIRHALAALVLALPLAAPAADIELIPRSSIFGNPTKSQGLISPDGKWLSWIAPRDGVLNVWVAPTDDPSKARPLTEEKIRPIRQHFWAKNSKMILFVNDRGGDENFLLYGVSPEGGDLKSYTPFQKTRVRVLKTSRTHPDELLLGINNRKAAFHDLHLLDLRTGTLKLVYENNEFANFEADEELVPRLAFKEKPGGALDVMRFDNGKTSPFATVPAEDSLTTNVIEIAPNGRKLLAVDSRGRDKAALVEIDLDNAATRVLGESAKADVAGVLLNPRTREPEAYSVNYLRNEWVPIGDAVKGDIEVLNRLIKGTWQVPSRNDADTHWVVLADEVVKPITYYLYDRQGRKLDPLFVTRPQLVGKPLAPMYGVEIKTRDGLTLPSMLTLPVGAAKDGWHPAKPLPMVLNVHGGPWAQDVFGYNSEAQWLANRGYAVLQVNYRGSTGFGKGFIESATREFGGKMHDDLIDAVRWAIDQKIAIPNKIAIYGGSYGGYATLVGMSFTPETFACGVDIVGPSSLVSLIESFPEYWKPFLEGTWYRRVGNPAKPEDREFLLSRSPITRVEKISRPLLIAQGANDPRVTQKESDQLVAAMEARKIPVTYVVYNDEGHGFARPENRVSFYAISEGFLSRCLGGRFEPIGDFKGTNMKVSHGADIVPGLANAMKAMQ
jgi:dipeptidyl aminopeptidase/acylaminoacyl peptidase